MRLGSVWGSGMETVLGLKKVEPTGAASCVTLWWWWWWSEWMITVDRVYVIQVPIPAKIYTTVDYFLFGTGETLHDGRAALGQAGGEGK